MQNIEKMMGELEALKRKKQELIERNNHLKEIQDRPQRDYSNNKSLRVGKTSSEKSNRRMDSNPFAGSTSASATATATATATDQSTSHIQTEESTKTREPGKLD